MTHFYLLKLRVRVISMNELKEVRLILADGNSLYSETPISNPEDAVRTIGKELLEKLDREMLVVTVLDNRNRPILYNIVSIGSINKSIVDIGNVFKPVLLSGSGKSLILMHNHPSGITTPSEEDILVTQKIKTASEYMDIPVLDHIIVGGGGVEPYYSFNEHDWPKSIKEIGSPYVYESISSDYSAVATHSTKEKSIDCELIQIYAKEPVVKKSLMHI